MTRIAVLGDDPNAVVRRLPDGVATPQVGPVAARARVALRDAAGTLPAWMGGAPIRAM